MHPRPKNASIFKGKRSTILFQNLSVAAATENNDDGKDDDPGTVIVKDVTQAVVIHYVCLRELLRAPCGYSISYYADSKKRLMNF